MTLRIEDDETVELIARLADRLKTTGQDAVRKAIEAELDRYPERVEGSGIETRGEFYAKIEDFYARHPLPPATGEKADKAFFDELSGEFD